MTHWKIVTQPPSDTFRKHLSITSSVTYGSSANLTSCAEKRYFFGNFDFENTTDILRLVNPYRMGEDAEYLFYAIRQPGMLYVDDFDKFTRFIRFQRT